MKKLQTTIKTICLVAIVLVMAQSCIPTVPGENPTPNSNLTGKIKSSTVTLNTILGQNNLSYTFEYDSLAKVSAVKVASSLMATNTRYTVVNQTDKFIIKDSTGITGLIYFLKPGTNLVDSIYDYMSGSKIHSIIIEREPSDNIKSITVKSGESLQYLLNDFVFENGNIISYNSISFNLVASVVVANYEVKYDTAKLKKPGSTFNLSFQMFGQSVALSDLILDADVFGLSFGNTNKNLITSIIWNESVDLSSQSGDKNFSYTNFTPTSIIINTTSGGSLISPVSVFNAIQNVENNYY